MPRYDPAYVFYSKDKSALDCIIKITVKVSYHQYCIVSQKNGPIPLLLGKTLANPEENHAKVNHIKIGGPINYLPSLCHHSANGPFSDRCRRI